MTQVPTPPASRLGSEAPEIEVKPTEASSELRQSLDILLEQYLHLLDRQQKLQSGLAKQLSSGFLSLAHANYTCPPGRRYGVDYYDERMKATRKIAIQSGLDNDITEHGTESQDTMEGSHLHDFEYDFHLETVTNVTPEDNTEEADDRGKSPPKAASPLASQQGITLAIENKTDSAGSQDAGADLSTPRESKQAPKKFRSDDPIHWYGILVPTSLRTAQKSFTEAIQTEVPELAAVTVEMRKMERKIAQLRMDLGVDSTEATDDR
ncbi:hypothetical protein N7462_001618 [Penicillium macrosclerotiorum]|uniref:uncharacterized protein n=1 Tax=Penicillium macrosclerotiorum TaxID=303699 RepID=UPI002547C858|nr:uncharacterized protein N7462_001618 [Penicillium macrosclerotiorum]KAJ5692195.1 hypothetical protein N7462_001618 [Penicillium macrosclerotiorum]